MVRSALYRPPPREYAVARSMNLISILANTGELVETRSLGGKYHTEEHVLRTEDGRTLTFTSQLCLACKGEGFSYLEQAVRDEIEALGDGAADGHWVRPGGDIPCPFCDGTGRMATKRTLRIAAQASAHRGRNAQARKVYLERMIERAEAGEDRMRALLVEVDQRELLDSGIEPGTGEAIVSLDGKLVERARRLAVDHHDLDESEQAQVLVGLRMQVEECDRDIADANDAHGFFTEQADKLQAMISGYERAVAYHDARQAAAVVAPTVVARHDPAKVCNGYELVKGKRKRCHRAPQEWDKDGKGWCRRHAHSRGLHKKGEVA